MIVGHIRGLLANPVNGWLELRAFHDRVGHGYRHVLLLALIPVVSSFIGTTRIGWQVTPGDAVRITEQSALLIASLYYLAIVIGVASIAYMIHWMAATYGAAQPFSRSLVLASYIPTPLFLAGLMQLYPVLWLNLVISLPAVAYSVALLYTGIPVMMEIPKERGFLFSSAVLAVGLVALVGMLAVTVILWGLGAGPSYTTPVH